jgi:outer membrane protein TolC
MITKGNFNARDSKSTSLDIAFDSNNVASAETGLLSCKLGRYNSASNTNILLGRYPSVTIKEPEKLSTIPTDVPPKLLSELLMRRPDLVAEAAQVHASASFRLASRK